MPERQQLQEVLQTVNNVLPDFAGDHSVAKILQGANKLEFLNKYEGYSSDLLRVVGENGEFGKFDIRLNQGYAKLLGLQLQLLSPHFKEELFFAWSGGNLNIAPNELYGHLLDVIDFKLNFTNNQLQIDSSPGGKQWVETYPLGQNRVVNYQNKLVFTEFNMRNNVAGLTIAYPNEGMPVSLSFPATIQRVDLTALPKVS